MSIGWGTLKTLKEPPATGISSFQTALLSLNAPQIYPALSPQSLPKPSPRLSLVHLPVFPPLSQIILDCGDCPEQGF